MDVNHDAQDHIEEGRNCREIHKETAKWQDNEEIADGLRALVHRNYTNKEISIIMGQRFPQYRWGLTALKKRLQALHIKRIDKDVHPDELLAALRKEMDGPGQHLGYRAMHKKIRETYKLLVTRNDVYQGMQIVCPSRMDERKLVNKRQKFRKRAFISKGPNWVWSLDGHDKLSGRNKHQFPFGIHACMDCFSRKILWIKVWPTNCSPTLPGKLFLDTIEALGIYPDFTRSDKGTENVIIAPMQTFLNQSDDAHMYGSSTTNHVIERWWRNCKDTQGEFFKAKFIKILRGGNYIPERNTCRVLLAFVYTGLVQKSLNDFATYWNNHRIRKQDIHRPCGVVNYLYECPEANGGVQCGKTPDPHRLAFLKTKVDSLKNMKFLDDETEGFFQKYLDDNHMWPITCNTANDCYQPLYDHFGNNNFDFVFS